MSATDLMSRINWRGHLHWLGGALALGGLVFVGIRLHGYSASLDFARITATTGWGIVLLSFVYAFASILLALAWASLLLHLGASVGHLWAVRAYAISQLAKYMPGNIFQFAGRQSLGMAVGIPADKLLISSVWEIGLIACAGASFGALGIPIFLHTLAPQVGLMLWIGIVAILSVLFVRIFGKEVSVAFLLQILFLCVSAGCFVWLLFSVHGLGSQGISFWPVLGGGYIVAWLVGLLTPGAPAGLGVREAVLLFLFHRIIPDSDLLLAVLLSRFTTVLGDLLFFLIATLLSTIPLLKTPQISILR